MRAHTHIRAIPHARVYIQRARIERIGGTVFEIVDTNVLVAQLTGVGETGWSVWTRSAVFRVTRDEDVRDF